MNKRKIGVIIVGMFQVFFLTLLSCGENHSSTLEKETTNKRQKSKNKLITITNLEIVVFELGIPPRDTFDLTLIEVEKDSLKPTFLKFQSGGTETNIVVVDSVYANNYQSMWDCPAGKRLNFGHDESGLLDISNLRKGTYYIQYVSCNGGGSYKLILTD